MSFLSNHPCKDFGKINRGMSHCHCFNVYPLPYVIYIYMCVCHMQEIRMLQHMWCLRSMWVLLHDMSWHACQIMSAQSKHWCFWCQQSAFGLHSLVCVLAHVSNVTGSLSIAQPPPVVSVASLSKAQKQVPDAHIKTYNPKSWVCSYLRYIVMHCQCIAIALP